VSSKPRLQVFLQNLHDEKAEEVARRMPFLKKDFKVGVTYINRKHETEGVFADSGIPLMGVDVEPLPPDDPFKFVRAVLPLLKEDAPDIAMAALPDPEAGAFLIAARAANVPFIVAEVDDQPSLISSFEELTSLYFCDLILPATRNLQRILTQALPDLSKKIGNLLPHSADTTYIQLTKEDRRRLREQLRVDTELKMITMIAPFDRRRDYDTLIEACALVKQRGHDFILLLVGDGPERRRIAEKVCALRLEDQVTIIDDPGDHIDILCATDIFALCTHFEGNSIPLIEAMAQGLAIAGTDVPGINDLIRDERSGRLAEPKKAESFAQALIDLLAQEKTRKKLGSVARKCIENRGNLNQFMPPFINALKKRIKEFSASEEGKKKARRNPGFQYVNLQEKIRQLWQNPDSDFGLAQAADLMDGYPINVQVDVLEKLCYTPLETTPLASFVRPLEKVLSGHYLIQFPLLEMRLYEKLAAFYIDLGYVEGAEKLIESLEKDVGRELFRYHFACNRFSGLRAHVRLSQLHSFVGHQDRRDFYRLELREFLRDNGLEENDHFHQQNAACLERLGEVKLALREMQKDALGTMQIYPGVPVARPAVEEISSIPGTKRKTTKSKSIPVKAADSASPRKAGEQLETV